jgi:hypothetical protein
MDFVDCGKRRVWKCDEDAPSRENLFPSSSLHAMALANPAMACRLTFDFNRMALDRNRVL